MVQLFDAFSSRKNPGMAACPSALRIMDLPSYRESIRRNAACRDASNQAGNSVGYQYGSVQVGADQCDPEPVDPDEPVVPEVPEPVLPVEPEDFDEPLPDMPEDDVPLEPEVWSLPRRSQPVNATERAATIKRTCDVLTRGFIDVPFIKNGRGDDLDRSPCEKFFTNLQEDATRAYIELAPACRSCAGKQVVVRVSS
jgi:hypothetical protein